MRCGRRATTIGATVSDTKVDTAIAAASVTANSWKKRPMMPGMKNSGMKAASSDRLIEITVKPICRAPSMAASIRPRPRSRFFCTLSIITMASSTTNPTEIVTAIRDRLSSVKPKAHMAAKVPAMDRGTATPAASVGVARRRNTSTTSITRQIVSASVPCMSRREDRMVSVRSLMISTSMAAGIQRLNSGSRARTRSTVSTTLAPG